MTLLIVSQKVQEKDMIEIIIKSSKIIDSMSNKIIKVYLYQVDDTNRLIEMMEAQINFINIKLEIISHIDMRSYNPLIKDHLVKSSRYTTINLKSI